MLGPTRRHIQRYTSMFKAIGRWGSQVRSSFNFPFMTNVFGTKSKKYGDLDNEEEIFIDALEEIENESDTEDNIIVMRSEHHKSEHSIPKTSVQEDENEHRVDDEQIPVSDYIADQSQLVAQLESTPVTTVEVEEICVLEKPESNDALSASQTEADDEHCTSDNTHDTGSESEDEPDGVDDDHHINHKDTTQMVNSSKQNNGLVKSSSAAMFQKVHRRMNSYTLRQYSKFDNAHDDENDNVIHCDDECSYDNVDSHVTDNVEQVHETKSEKKTKRKKKVAFFQFFRGFFGLNSRSKSTRIK